MTRLADEKDRVLAIVDSFHQNTYGWLEAVAKIKEAQRICDHEFNASIVNGLPGGKTVCVCKKCGASLVLKSPFNTDGGC